VLVGESSAEAIRRREARRLPLLRRKLVEELEAGRKIFVYHGMAPLTEAQAGMLCTAMRAYGPTTLLWVELCDRDTHPARSIEPARVCSKAISTASRRGRTRTICPSIAGSRCAARRPR
jgi:hypothetical protein